MNLPLLPLTTTTINNIKTSLFISIIFITSSLLSGTALCTGEIRIATADELVAFSNSVNSGTSYSEVSVYLDADIYFTEDLSGKFDPIGYHNSFKNIYVYFTGTFDGQGYTINDIAINSTQVSVGLFGYSKKLTLKNIVLGSSCSVMSFTYDFSNLFFGGILGYCDTKNGPCTIENSVNMASVSFVGNLTGNMYIGGIAGRLYSLNTNQISLKNCANYGAITHYGICSTAYIGGIVGHNARFFSNCTNHINNCLNYGPVTYNGATRNVIIGGIAGWCQYSLLENCLSTGEIYLNSPSISEYSGAITGTVFSVNTIIKNCYWTDKVGLNNTIGKGGPEMVNSRLVGLSPTVVAKLNGNIKSDEWSMWVINEDMFPVTFNVNTGKGYTIASEVLLLPSLSSTSSNTFSGWFTDANHTTKFTVSEIGNKTVLYGGWSYDVALDGAGGSLSQSTKRVICGNIYGEFPRPTKHGYAFLWWYIQDSDEKITSNSTVIRHQSHTLCAAWDINLVTFDPMGGVADFTSKNVTYNSVYGELPRITRTGYTLKGWFNDKNIFVDPNTTVDVAKDHTLHAQWTPITYYVTLNATGGTVNESSIMASYDKPYGDLPVPTKQNNTFLCWWYLRSQDEMEVVTSATNVSILGDHTLYAGWEVSTVTFVIWDKIIATAVMHNETITYPSSPKRSGHRFAGWDKNITVTRGLDVTITACWDKESSSNLSTILIAVICVLVIIAIALALAIYVASKGKGRWRRRKNDGLELEESLIGFDPEYDRPDYTRVVTIDESEANGGMVEGKTLDSLYKVYPQDYARPSMKDALLKAGLSGEQSEEVDEACANASCFSESEGKLFGEFTKEDAAAIAMYTYDFGSKKFGDNPYRIINRSLVGRNFNGLQKASGILYLVMTALRKLPRVAGITLYRGVRSGVTLDREHYHEGNTITWPALSSTSPDMKSIKAFLAKGGKRRHKSGTLFIIEGGWGYDIQPYSLFPEEAEILLEPDREFRVVSVIQTGEINIINLQMLDTPLALTQVYGEGNRDTKEYESNC